MRDIFSFIADFLFPPSKEALELRALSSENLAQKLPPSPTTPYPFIFSLFAYKNPLVKEMIWGIKYKKDRHAVKLGGYAFYEKLKGIDEKVLLVPIPISDKRRKERGYNQCELLVDEVMKLDIEGKFEKRFDILKRNKHTDRQTLKNRKERLQNAEEVFSVAYIPSQSLIIIIDDVTTTGSTLKEARDALLQAGYRDVRALTLAH